MKPSKPTIATTILLIVSLVNLVLTNTGHSPLPFSDKQIADGVSMGFSVVMTIVAWWRNNSFTYAALKGDERMRELKKK